MAGGSSPSRRAAKSRKVELLPKTKNVPHPRLGVEHSWNIFRGSMEGPLRSPKVLVAASKAAPGFHDAAVKTEEEEFE